MQAAAYEIGSNRREQNKLIGCGVGREPTVKINVVVALAAAASVIAAPGKKQLECKPHEEVHILPLNRTAVTMGFLAIDKYHRLKKSNDPKTAETEPVGTLQPSDGKLKVSTLSKDELKKDGKKFQVISCNAKGEEYHDKKLAPGQPLQNHTIVRGQLRTGDECVAVKDGEMKLGSERRRRRS